MSTTPSIEAFEDPVRGYVAVAVVRARRLKEHLTKALASVDMLLDDLAEADDAICDARETVQ